MPTTAKPENAFKVEYIQPFVDSLKFLFESHLGDSLSFGKMFINETAIPSYEVSAVIGFTGTVIGRAVISFPEDVATKVAMDFLQMDPLPEGVLEDCVGELTNIVVGRAKADFQGHQIVISPPTVVKGGNYTIAMQRGAACISIPCECKHGKFQLEISIVQGS